MWFLKPFACTCTSPSKSTKAFSLDLGCFLASFLLEVFQCTMHIYMEISTCKPRVCIQPWFLWMHHSSEGRSMKQLLQSMEAVSLFPLLSYHSSSSSSLRLPCALEIDSYSKTRISTFKKCITFLGNFFNTYCNMTFSKQKTWCKTKAYTANFNCI